MKVGYREHKEGKAEKAAVTLSSNHELHGFSLESAFLGLARELRKRCDLFDAGLLRGPELACAWYPVEVTYLSDGYVTDETTSTFAPGEPW